jgi:ADP-heptose:LPS heptosyltransferase
LSSNPHKKALVFFSAGVGDAILLVPLVNELKKQGYLVTGLFTSPFGCESIFENTHLFDDIKIKKNKLLFVLFSILNFRKYDTVFLNHFSFSKSNLTLAAFLGKDVYTNYKEFTSAQSSPAIHFIHPKPNTHDALQNVFLINSSATLSDLNFNLSYTSQNTSFNLPKNYIVIQASSANNKAPYKNWDIEKWLELFKYLQIKSPSSTLVLLGDNTELHLNAKINTANYPNVISFIGKTTLNDTTEIIYQSKYYIGLDSGLMHIAVALNKPTFTIWGASNLTLYGYEWLNAKHKIVSLNLACAPCSSWLNANTSRVSNPLNCPDFKCIKDISVEMVTEELDKFIENI